MCIKSVFESINSIRHNDIVRKAFHMFTIRLLKKFFRRSYLHLFTSNLLQSPLVKSMIKFIYFYIISLKRGVIFGGLLPGYPTR